MFSVQDSRRASGGFSLIEMVVASAIFAIVAAVAFILYTAAQKSYKMGENFTDQQQSTRVAFDRMLSDMRLAGYNWNPDGDTTRVDEQVEGMWDTAVTVRGDFDFEDPAAATTPEASLPGTVYNVVSTGNDEIVSYVLAKPGVSGPATLALRMDVNRPRTKTLQNVTVSNISLVHDNPPYTLYRVTLADIASFPGTPPNGGAFVFEPVADNVRSLRFQYYDDTGALLNPDTPANAGDDVGGGDANAVIRARVRRIAVSLVGMTPDEDLAYVDASDAVAQHFRKFDLSSDVLMENLGRSGVRDLDVTAPPPPTGVGVVPGHCAGVLVKWDPPSSSSGITAYSVKYYLSGSPSAFTTRTFTHPHMEYGVVDYDPHAFVDALAAGNWCFQVQARDAAGNQSGWAPASLPPCTTLSNTTTPSTPLNVAATGNGTLNPLDSQIQISWQEVKNNTGTLTGDSDVIGGTTILRDFSKYALQKSLFSDMSGATALPLVSEPVLGPGNLSYTDLNVVNCQNYYYRVVAEDKCAVQSAGSAIATGRASSNIPPAKPTSLAAQRTSRNTITLNWPQVTTKADGTAGLATLYNVYRLIALTGTPIASLSPGSFTLRGAATTITSGVVSYVDALTDTGPNNDVNMLQTGYSAYYIVSATDLCPNESLKSDPVEVYCTFNGSFTTVPADGASNAGSVPLSVYVSGSEQIERARVRIPNLSSPGTDAYYMEVTNIACNAPCTISLGTWDSTAAPPGAYTIHWEVENNKGCIVSDSTTFDVMANLACQITPTNPNLSPTSGKPSTQNRKLSWDIVNNAGKDLDIYLVEVAWTNVLGPHTLIQMEFPTGTGMLPFTCTTIASTTSSASMDCSFLPMTLGSAQTLNMSLEWDLQIVDTSNTGENVTIRYTFSDPSAATGTCTFTVKPDLTI